MPLSPQSPQGATNAQRRSRYLTLARRAAHHWGLAGGVFLLTVGLSVGLAFSRARIYRSECLVYYQEEMRKDMLGDREAERARDLTHKLHQILWSRTRLMEIVRAYNLYPDLRATRTQEEVVEAMRGAIAVRAKGGDTFWIAYEGKEPKTVQAVAQRLADTFVEENARDAVERSRTTSEFIERESTKAKADLQRAAGGLTRFYQAHPDLVPEGTQDPRAPGAAVRAFGKAARSAGRRPRYVIEGASPELRALLAEKGRQEAQLSLLSPHLAGASERQQELRQARGALGNLRARFSEDYPDVARARAHAERLERQLAAERRGGGDTESGRLRAAIARLDGEIARLAPKARRLAAHGSPETADAGTTAVTATERVETDYSRLTQAYEVAKARAATLSDKQLNARVLSNLEASQQQATFRIVDPASLPEKAIRPSRRKIVTLGAVLGLLLTLAALAVRVVFDPRIYDETDLIGLSGLPLLAQVPRAARSSSH